MYLIVQTKVIGNAFCPSPSLFKNIFFTQLSPIPDPSTISTIVQLFYSLINPFNNYLLRTMCQALFQALKLTFIQIPAQALPDFVQWIELGGGWGGGPVD